MSILTKINDSDNLSEKNIINDKYYLNLAEYDVNTHGLTNDAIINDINTESYETLNNAYFSDFYKYNYKHHCHPDTAKHDFEILKNLISNDHTFSFNYRDSYNYDNIINKYLNIDFLKNEKFTDILKLIFIKLDNEQFNYNKKNLITYFNEWLLNFNININYHNDLIVDKFIIVFKKYIHDYNILFSKKHNTPSYKKNKDFAVFKSNMFNEENLCENEMVNDSFNKYRSTFNNFDQSNLPSKKYNKTFSNPKFN